MSQISVIVNTLNEERWIGRLVRSSMKWADEVLVVDMHSDDATARIAAENGARVLMHERMGNAEPARRFAVESARFPWIMIIDADELVTVPLAERLRALAASGEYDAARIPRQNYIAGAPLKYTGWGPVEDAQPRFFRKGFMIFSGLVHSGLAFESKARVVTLPQELALVHFNYFDFTHFMEKLNRYTSIEMEEWRAQGKKVPSPFGAMLLALRTFRSRYLAGKGYRDGWRGWYLSWFMTFYTFLRAAKQYEVAAVGDRKKVEESYTRTADEIAAEFSQHEFAGKS